MAPGKGPGLGLRTDRIGVWGASAGAYLGSLLALTASEADLEGDVGGNLDHSSGVQAAVHWFGQSDLLTSGSRTAVEALSCRSRSRRASSAWVISPA